MKTIIIKKLQIRLSWTVVLCLALGFSVLLKLGFWQLARAEEKQQMIRDISLRQSLAPLAIDSLSTVGQPGFEHRQITLQGRYLNAKTILIKRQLYRGRYGYEVISPFMPVNQQQLLLVSRGWIAAGQELPMVVAIKGEISLTGSVHFPTGQAFFNAASLPQPTWPLLLHRLTFQGLAPLFERKLAPFVLRLNQQSPGVYTRHWQPTVIKPATNTSYALQWFALSIVLLLAALLASSNVISLIKNR